MVSLVISIPTKEGVSSQYLFIEITIIYEVTFTTSQRNVHVIAF